MIRWFIEHRQCIAVAVLVAGLLVAWLSEILR